MCYTIVPENCRFLIRHARIGRDWTQFNRPLTTFARCLNLRGQAGPALLSVHIDNFTITAEDLTALLKYASDLRLIGFGKHKYEMDEIYKTVALQTNTELGEAAFLIHGIGRIVIRSFGPPTPGFRETLEIIINNNIGSLREIDFQSSFEDGFPVEFPPRLRLESISTSNSMFSFLIDLPNVNYLRHMECRMTEQVPTWGTAPNLMYVKLNLGVEDWDGRQMGKFIPNLRGLEIRSAYMQSSVYDEQKITLNNVALMKGMFFGVLALQNFIAPELLEVEVTPMSREFNNHIRKYSKKLEVFRAKDNLTLP